MGFFTFLFFGRRSKPRKQGTEMTVRHREIIRAGDQTVSDRETIEQTELTVTPVDYAEQAEPGTSLESKPADDDLPQADTGALAAAGAYLKRIADDVRQHVAMTIETKRLCMRIQADMSRHMQTCATQQALLSTKRRQNSGSTVLDANIKLYSLQRELRRNVLEYTKALGYDGGIPMLVADAPGAHIQRNATTVPPALPSVSTSLTSTNAQITDNAWVKAHAKATSEALIDEFQRVLNGVAKARTEANPMDDVRRDAVVEVVYELLLLANSIHTDMQHLPIPTARRFRLFPFSRGNDTDQS